MVVVTVMLSVTVTVTGGGHSDVLLVVMGEYMEVGGSGGEVPVGKVGTVPLETG